MNAKLIFFAVTLIMGCSTILCKGQTINENGTANNMSVTEIDFQDFISKYVLNGISCREMGINEMTFVKISEDSIHTVYGYRYNNSIQEKYSVKTKELVGLDWSSFDGKKIYEDFIKQKIPAKISNRIARNSKLPTRIDSKINWDVTLNEQKTKLYLRLKIKKKYGIFLRDITFETYGQYDVSSKKLI